MNKPTTSSGATANRKIKRSLRVIAKEDCENCSGSGMKVSSTYYDILRKLDITVEICSCVHVVHSQEEGK
jgi:hypothetical protein